MAIERKWVREWTMRELGFPQVHIELDDEQLNHCIDNAFRVFNRYMCAVDLRVLYNVGGFSSSDDTGSGDGSVVIHLEDTVRGICEVKVMLPRSQRSYAEMNVFEIAYRMVFPRFPVSDWYFFRSYYEMFQQVRGTDPGWRYNEFDRTLYVDCSSGPYDIFYVAAFDLSLDNIDHKSAYMNDFLDLVCARAKFPLSRALGKFQGIPSPGGTISTDHAELRKEYRETEDRIVERLKAITRLSGSVVTLG